MKIYKRVFLCSIILCIASFLLTPEQASAHLGGGPPFVKVNGKYSPTNLNYTGSSQLILPQDYAPEVYLKNTPITFELDENNLGLPPEIQNQMMYRWSFYQGNNFSDNIGGFFKGKNIVHTFAAAKSYLVKLEAKTNQDTEFTILDTVLVNVVPFKGYKVPQGDIEIQASNFTPTDTIEFENKTTYDTSVKQPIFFWDFGEGAIDKGRTIKKTFTTYNSYLYARAIDDNGLITDTTIGLQILNNKLRFSPVGYIAGTTVNYGKVTQVEVGVLGASTKLFQISTPNKFLILFIISLGVIITGLLIVRLRKKRRK